MFKKFVVDIDFNNIYGINVKTGIFGADMQVELINDGPVTIMLDSKEIVKNS